MQLSRSSIAIFEVHHHGTSQQRITNLSYTSSNNPSRDLNSNIKYFRTTSPPTILFIHGMEYHSPQEVVSDLITPFCRQLPQYKSEAFKDFRIIFIHWDSRLLPEQNMPLYPFKNVLRNLGKVSNSAFMINKHFSSLKSRAEHTGRHLARVLQTEQIPAPALVISHSMGGVVWAECMKSVLMKPSVQKRNLLDHIWWNMQAALAKNSFSRQGPYEKVGQYYRQTSSQMLIWHAKYDLILNSLYVIATGGQRALGQSGTAFPCQKIRNINVTRHVKEAHGQTIFTKENGCFFQRIRQDIQLLFPYSLSS